METVLKIHICLENRVIKIIRYYYSFFVENKEDHIKVKLERAQGECLGTGSRRRTWLTAISLGEL